MSIKESCLLMKIDESCVLMRVIMAIEVIACDVSPVAMFYFLRRDKTKRDEQ